MFSLHLCGSWFWESIPWWMFFDWKFVSSISESLFFIWCEAGLLGYEQRGWVFFLPVVFFLLFVCMGQWFRVSTAMWTWRRHVIMWIAGFPYTEFGVIEQSACVQLSGGQVGKHVLSMGFSGFCVAVPRAWKSLVELSCVVVLGRFPLRLGCNWKVGEISCLCLQWGESYVQG